MLKITGLYAGLLGLLFLSLSIAVIRLRRRERVSLGAGGKLSLERAIRTHANFAEYVPLILILMAIMEMNKANPSLLYLMGSLLFIGRVLHAYCFIFTESLPPMRVVSMALTFTTLVMGALGCLGNTIYR